MVIGEAPTVIGDAPMVIGDAPMVVGGAPMVVGGAPMVVGGAPMVVGGAPMVVGDAPMVMDGASITMDMAFLPVSAPPKMTLFAPPKRANALQTKAADGLIPTLIRLVINCNNAIYSLIFNNPERWTRRCCQWREWFRQKK